MGTVGKIISSIVVGLIIVGIFVGIGLLMTSSIDIEQTEAYIFQYINEERANCNLSILGNDTNLSVISNQWSEHLASVDDLTHGDFEGRIASIGYSYYSCGEVIGSFASGSINGIPTTDSPSELAREFVDMWLDSPPHREIMLTSSSGYMGVGVNRNGSEFYGVVDFRFG